MSAETPKPAPRRRFPSTFYNTITLGGAALAAISLGLILFLMALEALSHEHKPYMGIIAFVILPGFLIAGMAAAAFGVLRQQRRRRLGLPSTERLPRIDLNDPAQLRAAVLVGSGGVLFLLLTAFGSFKAYEYTDSDQFCGTVCHEVMKPEYTAYQASPHARVGCVECHIGSGAEWYVRSKLSGAYQLYSVAFNKFSRPIETPIRNLRPSRDTCETVPLAGPLRRRQDGGARLLRQRGGQRPLAPAAADAHRRRRRRRARRPSAATGTWPRTCRSTTSPPTTSARTSPGSSCAGPTAPRPCTATPSPTSTRPPSRRRPCAAWTASTATTGPPTTTTRRRAWSTRR